MALSPARARKRRRLGVVILAVAILGVAVALVLFALRDTVVFFFGPSEVISRLDDPKLRLQERRFRMGGLVEEGSVTRLDDGKTTEFRITDDPGVLTVRHTGLLPDLFREGQGVVAEGRLDAEGRFIADEVLAKHDENYMPKEVADALKKTGHWQGESEAQP